MIARDLSWLSFNARVLQEAADKSVPLKQRIAFLGIFSNNLDEFFRVRVAALKRMVQLNKKNETSLYGDPQKILDEIQRTVLDHQSEFNRIWEEVQNSLKAEKIFIKQDNQLTAAQKKYVKELYDTEVSANVIPLMIENIKTFPHLREKSLYLGIVMWKKESALNKKYAIIEVPSKALGRFFQLPAPAGQHHIILLEDIIRVNLPEIFSFFGYDKFSAHVFKVTRDAELDLEADLSVGFIEKIEKGLKNRRKGKPVRFVYDKEMEPGLLEYLIIRLNLKRKDNIIPGGRIHNFKHFMNFPSRVFKTTTTRKQPFEHPLLVNSKVSDIVLKQDVMLHFPYHRFNPLIDLIREAAFNPDVTTIKITCYRLAAQSKIINALINAKRNGKEVVVLLELQARFDEEANLDWKTTLEEEGVTVLVGIPNMKVHSKICLIKKRYKNKITSYGFISTGNFNENTAKIYGDHCLLTSDPKIMADMEQVFNYLQQYKTGNNLLDKCSLLIPSPSIIRTKIYKLIDFEIAQAKQKKASGLTLKMNSLSDPSMIEKLMEAAIAGVPIQLIVRSIYCLNTENKKYKSPITATSIVDEYLEHARVWVFHHGGNEQVYISSADWMTRNLDHRVEISCPITDPNIQQELKEILQIQLQDNVKARILDNVLSNSYVQNKKKKVRSQVAIYNYLSKKNEKDFEISGNRHRK